MPSIYLYVSKGKIDQLSEQNLGLLSKVTAKIDFKLPFASGEFSGKTESRTFEKLERLLPLLHEEYSMPMFTNIDSTTSPVFFTFYGQAVRTIEDNQFWLAMDGDKVALLLAGSASYVLGNSTNTSSVISPSADPVGSFLRVANNSNKNDLQGISANLSYTWQEIIADSIRSEITLPYVEGIAVFAATLKASKAQMRRVQRTSIESLVVGTPLYVRQVDAKQMLLRNERRG